MTAILFDTLELATKLKAVGFTEEQARAITSAQQDVASHTLEQARHDYHLDEVTTKRDLKELEYHLESRIKDTELKIAETKADLIRWVVGVGLLQITIITALLMKIANHL